MMRTVSVLGTDYTIWDATPKEDPVLQDNDGYCDYSVHMCVVNAQMGMEPDSLKDMDARRRMVTRHELIHAFLCESGLGPECEWACEEMVDWLARQYPKIAAAFEKLECDT